MGIASILSLRQKGYLFARFRELPDDGGATRCDLAK